MGSLLRCLEIVSICLEFMFVRSLGQYREQFSRSEYSLHIIWPLLDIFCVQVVEMVVDQLLCPIQTHIYYQ